MSALRVAILSRTPSAISSRYATSSATPAACIRASTDESGSSTSSSRRRSPALSIRSDIAGASSATAAASGALTRQPSPNSWPVASAAASSSTEPRTSTPRYVSASAERSKLGAAGSSRYPASIVSTAMPPSAPSAASRAASASFASCAHFGAADASAAETSFHFATWAYAACPPPAETAIPPIRPSSIRSCTAFGASDDMSVATSSAVVSRRSSSDISNAGLVLRPTSSSRFDRLLELALQLVGPLEELLDGAEVLHELRRRLVADARDAGDVVGGIALQGDEVAVFLRRKPVAGGHRFNVVPADVGDALDIEHHADPGANHLEEIAIGGDDRGVDPLVDRLECERRDNVVSLVPFDAEDRDAGRLEDLDD